MSARTALVLAAGAWLVAACAAPRPPPRPWPDPSLVRDAPLAAGKPFVAVDFPPPDSVYGDAAPAGLPERMPKALEQHAAQGIEWSEGAWEEQDYEFIVQLGPAGSMSSTALDMARYMLAHLNDGERALQEGDLELAEGEAMLVLELKGITSKQRQDAGRLMRSARQPRPKPKEPPKVDP